MPFRLQRAGEPWPLLQKKPPAIADTPACYRAADTGTGRNVHELEIVLCGRLPCGRCGHQVLAAERVDTGDFNPMRGLASSFTRL